MDAAAGGPAKVDLADPVAGEVQVGDLDTGGLPGPSTGDPKQQHVDLAQRTEVASTAERRQLAHVRRCEYRRPVDLAGVEPLRPPAEDRDPVSTVCQELGSWCTALTHAHICLTSAR